MKEKIGIEKLIELFKEYVDNHGTDTKDIEKEYGVIDDGQAFLYGQRTYLYETLISKKFGMVKWLVENDKIDFSNLKIDELTSGTDLFYSFSKTEVLLMILVIQEQPISFLCEILK